VTTVRGKGGSFKREASVARAKQRRPKGASIQASENHHPVPGHVDKPIKKRQADVGQQPDVESKRNVTVDCSEATAKIA